MITLQKILWMLLLVEKLAQTAEELDDIWNGDGTNATEFDGYLKLILS